MIFRFKCASMRDTAKCRKKVKRTLKTKTMGMTGIDKGFPFRLATWSSGNSLKVRNPEMQTHFQRLKLQFLHILE